MGYCYGNDLQRRIVEAVTGGLSARGGRGAFSCRASDGDPLALALARDGIDRARPPGPPSASLPISRTPIIILDGSVWAVHSPMAISQTVLLLLAGSALPHGPPVARLDKGPPSTSSHLPSPKGSKATGGRLLRRPRPGHSRRSRGLICHRRSQLHHEL